MPIIPEDMGAELDAPFVPSDYLLNPDGTLNEERVILGRSILLEAADFLSQLLSTRTDRPRPVAIRINGRSWDFLLDGEDHIVSPETFNDPRLGDPKVLRNRIHAGMQYLRNTTGKPWYAKVETRETKDGAWYFAVRAYLKGTADTDSQEDEDQPDSPK